MQTHVMQPIWPVRVRSRVDPASIEGDPLRKAPQPFLLTKNIDGPLHGCGRPSKSQILQLNGLVCWTILG